jgi:hypothetical protein
MCGGKRDVVFRLSYRKLGLVQPVDRAAGDVFDVDAGLCREFPADRFVDQVAEAAAPNVLTTSLSFAEAADGAPAMGSAARPSAVKSSKTVDRGPR